MVEKSIGNSEIVEIIEYTDPYCTWCWGSEPILRKIHEVFGKQVRISFKMGGLVKDIRRFYDPVNRIGGDSWYTQVAEHWLEAFRIHGMPVDAQVFYEIKDEFTSTYPANIAVKAAEFQDVRLANRYLRRLREAAAAERMPIHRIDIQANLADEVGLNKFELVKRTESGEAEKAFFKDIQECRAKGVTGFPTFQVTNLKNNMSFMIHGYHRYEYFEVVIDEVTEGSLVKRNITRDEDEVVKFVFKWRKVATQEVATLLDIDKNDAVKMLFKLEKRGLIISQIAGNDYFWKPVGNNSTLCDSDNKTCNFM